jgi:signal transduction histidine kinase
MQGSVAEVTMDLKNRTGERIPVLINIARRRDGPSFTDHWALFRATDRRAYERELLAARRAAEAALEAHRDAEARLQQANARLLQADQRKDEFLATLSHELRNPLSPMRSALDILKLKFGDGAQAPLLQVFDRQLRHLTRLIDDLMEISRITQGRMRLQRSAVDLAGLADGVVQDLAATIAAAGHTLRVSCAPGPMVVDGDATRLAQVVINLLTNAAKYTPERGIIDLCLSCAGGFAQIEVADNGIGIPAHALPTIFEMFSQLEPALKRANGGLGIGLALVRGIVELHGGTVTADSGGPGQGSRFTVRLPLAQAGGEGAAAPQRVRAVPKHMRAMVVDDNKDAAETLAATLQLLGCEVRAAHTGAEALALARAFRPSIALLDIGLPDMTGYDLAAALRQCAGLEDVTLVATTGWGQQKDRERALAAGFDQHLTKPVDLDALRAILGNPGNA